MFFNFIKKLLGLLGSVYILGVISGVFFTPAFNESNPTLDKDSEIQFQQATLGNFKVNYAEEFRVIEYLVREIFALQEYYFDSETDAPFIVDCGSNIGLSIMYFKMIYPNAKIIGFEADEKTFKVLDRNVHDNTLTDVTIYNKAVTNEKGQIHFFYNDGNSGLGSILGEQADVLPLEKTVEADTLSSYINQPVDCLKLDIEGAETGVLEDLHKNNKLHFIKRIVMEFHQNISNSKNSLAKFLSILEENNFNYVIENDGPMDFSRRLSPKIKNKHQNLCIYACQNT